MSKTERMAEVARILGATSFYQMPASAKYHNNTSGGLLQHCTNVWCNLEKLTSDLGLRWQDPSSPYIIAMLHDACKIGAYYYNQDYGVWEREPLHPEGHGDLSLKVIEKLGIELTEEERLCIRWHMGAFDEVHNWDKFTDAIHQYPNVFWTHVADMSATHIDEIKKPEEEPRVCCLCGEPLQKGEGNNPAPLMDEGVCCDHCNFHRVIPVRLEDTKYEE